jgi:hypothetical protein
MYTHHNLRRGFCLMREQDKFSAVMKDVSDILWVTTRKVMSASGKPDDTKIIQSNGHEYAWFDGLERVLLSGFHRPIRDRHRRYGMEGRKHRP